MTTSPPKLSLRLITKKYGDTFFANKDINFDLRKGEVHALVGENGAGKTTLMKILFGLESSSDGEIFLDGEEILISSPVDAKKHRIGMVHQHFMLEDQLSVQDHLQIEINSITKNWGFASLRNHKLQISDLMKKLGFEIPLQTPIGRLTVVQKQKVEILKTLLFDPEIMVFDEPTAVLPPDEISNFYQLVGQLKAQKKCIALITHKISDVIQHADTVTVLRHGEVQFCAAVKSTSESEIARHMIGASTAKELARAVASGFKIQDTNLPAPLEIQQFSILPKNKSDRSSADLEKTDLRVRHGEIVAFAGVEGNGQNALLSYLIRPDSIRETLAENRLCEGQIKILGQRILDNGVVQTDDATVRKLSVGFIGPDRLSDSAILDYKLSDHFRLLPFYRSKPFLNSITKKTLDDTVTQLDIRPPNTEMKLGQYSGGNQQKWVVGRETSHLPELLFACHPTRGVDFAATDNIHKILVDIKHRNRSVVLLSSDLDEILKISDRILIFFEGRIHAEFAPPYDRHQIGRAFGGLK
jgi:general nucleoside transport system ATP-binding protein